MPFEGECLLDRIGDHDQMPACAIGSDTLQTSREFIRRDEEIADENHLGALRQRFVGGKIRMAGLWHLPLGDEERLRQPLDDIPGGDRPRHAKHADPLSAPHQEVGRRETKDQRPIGL